jgi:hypothetical protein
MKSPTIALFFLFPLIMGSVSCGGGTDRAATAVAEQKAAAQPPETTAARTDGVMKFGDVSLNKSETAEQISAATYRKIIRNADLTIEVASPTETQSKVVSIAEAHGGFVVNSEAKQRDNGDATNRTLDIKLMVRIPEDQFGAVLDKVRGLANNRNEEKVTGQDVTEEFIDLEARIKTQRALETQFLQIMKQAGTIEDALAVQRQIAEVRTEIEKLEGRKRFLENRSSLSTIVVNILAPNPIAVNTTGFGRSVRDAVSESVDLGAEIVLFLVRFVIVMIPITLLLLLPGGLILRYFIRRARRVRLAAALAGPIPEGAP